MRFCASKKAVVNFAEVVKVNFVYGIKDKRLGKVIKRENISSLDGSIPMIFFYMKLLQTIQSSIFLTVK